MRRPAVLVALLVLAVFTSVARSDTVAELPSVGPDQDTHEADIGPVITADGSIILAVQSSATAIDIVRLAPGSPAAPQVLETLPAADGSNTQYDEPGMKLFLLAAGQGFFLYRIDRAAGAAPYSTRVVRNSLEWFPTSSGPGTVIASCEGGCGGCGDALRPLGADADHAIIAAASCGPGGRLRAVVRDLVSGEERPFEPPWWISAGALIRGRFAAERGGVMDWTTGQVLHQTAYKTPLVVTADGTLLYSRATGLFRLGPQDTRPTAVPISGSVQKVAGDAILTVQNGLLSTWNADGTRTGTLSGFDDYGGPESLAFDGHRIVYARHHCLFVRVIQWSIDGGDAASPQEYCDLASPTGSITLGPTQARLVLTCPADSRFGCVGSVRTAIPLRKARTYSLHAGEQREVTIVSGLAPSSCRAIAAPTWKVEVIPNDWHGYRADERGAYQDVDVVNACGRKR